MDKEFMEFLHSMLNGMVEEVKEDKNVFERVCKDTAEKSYTLFKAHVDAGFTEEQALEIVKLVLGNNKGRA